MIWPGGPVAYEVDDGIPATIRIVPSNPVPETSSDGVPTAMLYVSKGTGMLTLGAHWWPSELELSELRQRLGTAMQRAPEEFFVTPDAVRVKAVLLLLMNSPGDGVIELARSTSSSVPPFTALFSANVGEHLDAVQRACSGEPRLLFVQVEAELTRGRSATTTLAAQLAGWADELLGPDAAGLVAQIDALAGRGTIHRTRSATPDLNGPADDLAEEADRLAAQRFSAAVQSAGRVGAGGVSTVAVAATAHRPELTPLVRRADVGSWLRTSPGRHVLVAADPAEQAEQSVKPAGTPTPSRRVELGFAPVADAMPITEIVVSAGGEPVAVRPPFNPVNVLGADELAVTTNYSAGASYRVTLPSGANGWSLSPADLGLVQVSIDATRLRDAGADSVQAEVFYQPEDRGSPDRRTVHFEPDSWRADWFVVSRGPELAGQLLLNLAVTPAGLPDVRPALQSTTPTVQL